MIEISEVNCAAGDDEDSDLDLVDPFCGGLDFIWELFEKVALNSPAYLRFYAFSCSRAKLHRLPIPPTNRPPSMWNESLNRLSRNLSFILFRNTPDSWFTLSVLASSRLNYIVSSGWKNVTTSDCQSIISMMS
jgi:hypothetical protein